jgi:hypothetical protein
MLISVKRNRGSQTQLGFKQFNTVTAQKRVIVSGTPEKNQTGLELDAGLYEFGSTEVVVGSGLCLVVDCHIDVLDHWVTVPDVTF